MKFIFVLFIILGTTPSVHAQSDPGVTVKTHHETIPNPVFGSSLRVSQACHNTQCVWESASTWTTGTVPNLNSRVIIDGPVLISGPNAVALSIGIYPGGILSFSPSFMTRLRTADLVVFAGGQLIIGTEQSPITGSADIVFRDIPFAINDLGQHLRGLVSVNGTVRIHGRNFTETFLRTTIEPQAGHTSVTVESSVVAEGWRLGDLIAFPKSSQCASPSGTGINCTGETEERIISAVSADGKTITLSSALQFSHPGGRDTDGTITFFPHVINKTRNVIIHSENPNGIRGHILFHARSDVDMRYASIQEMGRTDIRNLKPGTDNQKGRYPLHAHHLIGLTSPQTNGHQFTFIGNIVDFGIENHILNKKWGIAIHGSHYGLIEKNIVDRASGAGLVTEDMSETGNVFRKNFVVGIIGGNNARTEDVDPIDKTKLGRAGVSYWFNGGGGNIFEDNIAAGVAHCPFCYGYKFDNIGANTRSIPVSQGSDPYVPGQGKIIDGYEIGITRFERNEAYAVPNGLTVWWLCTELEEPRDNCSSVIKDFRLWHHHQWGFFGYQSNNTLIDGWISRNRVGIGTVPARSSLYLGDYMTRNMVIRGADIQGADVCIHTPSNRDERNTSGPDAGIFTIEESTLSCKTLIYNRPQFSTGGSGGLSPQTLIVKNTTCSHPATLSGPNVTSPLQSTGENMWLRNDVRILNSPTCGDSVDVYLMPTYQESEWCDNGIADCSQDITQSLGNKILKMRAFPLRITPGPPSWATPPVAPTEFNVTN